MSDIIPTRLYVIELAIGLEITVNQTLGELLSINPERSKSLGNQSTGLSFSQKITLSQDVQNISRVDVLRLEFVMRIRNKFAHVAKVSNFQDFFDQYDKDGAIENSLKRWYYKPEECDNISKEELYKYFFNCMIYDLTTFMQSLQFHIINNKRIIGGVPLEKILRTNDYLMALFDELKRHENGEVIIQNVGKRFLREGK